MSTQSLENYNRKGAGEPPKRCAELRREQHHAQELPSMSASGSRENARHEKYNCDCHHGNT